MIGNEFSKKVTIVTPVYNSSDFIIETIESVQSQTFSDWEMILVDDCSSDDSVNIIKSYSQNDSRITLIKLEKNAGAAVARNRAIENAKGRFIAFLDSDDLWKPNKLEAQINFMQENRFSITFSKYDVMDEQGNLMNSIGVPSKVNYSDLLKTNYIGCLTVIYDTSFFGKVYMPLIRRRQDYALWLLLLKKVDYAYGLNISLAKYRLRKGSISSNKAVASMFTWRVYREVEKLSLIKSVYYFIHYFMQAILRRKLPSLARKLGILV